MPSSEKLPIIKLLASPRPACDASPRSFAFAGAPPGDPKGPERSDATFGGRSIAATRVTPRGSTPILPSVSPDPPGSSKSGTRERFVGMAPPRGGRAAKKPAPEPEPDDGGDTNCERCGLGDDEPNLVLCDDCPRGWHVYCLRPKLSHVPKGRWACPTCDPARACEGGRGSSAGGRAADRPSIAPRRA